jgi:hypothetical protein
MFKKPIIGLLLLSLGTSAIGATYYVRTDGNDSNSGTSNTSGGAWRTISKAASTVVAGDTVNVAVGSYAESVTESSSGTSASRITYNLASGVVVVGNLILSGNYITWIGGKCSPTSAGPYYAVNLSGSYLIVSNIEVTAYGAVASDQATGIGILGSNIELDDAHIHDMNDIDAFHVWGQNNVIRRALVHGIVQVNYAQNHTDQFQTWGNGSDCFNIYWVNCTFTNNNCQFGNTENDGYSNLHDWYYINCVFQNVSGTFFSGLAKTKFYNCLFDNVLGDPLSNVITFYGITGYSSVGSEVQNCVFYRCGGGIGFNGSSQSDITATHNYIGTSSFGTQGDWVGSSSVNGGNPQFANVSAMDYRIGSGSVLIAAGVNLSSVLSPAFTADRAQATRPSTGAWDIGPYQFASPITNPVISVSPTTLSFGRVASGATATNSFTVQNVGAGTLSGTASVAAPFAIVSGASYSLGAGQSQTVPVTYTPSGASTDSKTVTFTGGGGVSATISGSLLAGAPTVSPISDNATDVDPALPGEQIYAGSVVQYSGTASGPGGLPLTWQWIYTVNGGPETVLQSGSGTVPSVSFNYAASSAGSTYVWILRVSNGSATAQSSLTVGVEPAPMAGGATIQASSAVISAPFVLTNGYIYEATQTTDPTTGGRAAFTFTVTNAGAYVIQALVNAASDAANSFYVNIDAEPQDPTMIWDIPITSGFEQRMVSWRGNGTDVSNQFVPKSFTLTSGQHQVIIRGREAQTELASLAIIPLPPAPMNLRVVQGP